MSRFLRRRWPVVAGFMLAAVLVFLGVHTAVTSGGGNGLTPGQWASVSAVPTSPRVEILAVEGGCREFNHAQANYGRRSITITTWDKVSRGPCPANLIFEAHTVSLPGPIGSRQIVGACPPTLDAVCAEVQQAASPTSPPASSS